MHRQICSMLDEIEKRENIRILHCVESGSRAWGVASPDSDYDVRFVYTRQPRDYLRLEKTADIIQWQPDDTLDVNGWDLKKTLQLLHNSNPTVFEWNASPIVYRTSNEWAQLQPMLNACFSKKKCIHHYLSMARTHYREYLQSEKVRIKKYFYAIRPLLAAQWIMVYDTPPPMALSELAEVCLPGYLQDELLKLTEQKMRSPEITEGLQNRLLNDYIETSLSFLQEAVRKLPEDHTVDWETLNSVFCKMLKEPRAS